MASSLNQELRAEVTNPDAIKLDPFGILHRLARASNIARGDQELGREVRELVLLALDKQELFGTSQVILESLLRDHGLYPYLDTANIGFRESVAIEVNRPENLDDVVFHSAQARVYFRLLRGENVILSAPTSFGKSLIIDALIATQRYSNVVVVVPTIALIDETRRRLASRFGDRFKVITHPNQERTAKNIFVFTQERVLEAKLEKADLVVIDEFYKLDPRSDAERSNLLNQAFYMLRKTRAQFYLLGPSIRSIPDQMGTNFEYSFIATDYATVVTETTRVTSSPADRLNTLVGLCSVLAEPTLIYCSSPASARNVATALLAANVGHFRENLIDATDWIGEHFHPDWIFGRALQRGIGIHHGKIPRALAQFVVRSFNSGELDFLVCTSTLIEGVNTKAKNVIVFDNKIATRNFDFFTFNNIRGRSGRMGHHVIGKVFLFYDPPQESFPDVDIPMLSQSESASNALLMQMDDADLTEMSLERVKSFKEQSFLDAGVIRENNGLDPAAQIELAELIADRAEELEGLLAWTGNPSWEQLKTCCELIWDHFIVDHRRRAGVSSGSQLAFKIRQYRTNPETISLIETELESQDDLNPDEAVESTLEFIRFWVTYHFPRYLMALNRIQLSVLSRTNRRHGDYRSYAAQLENCLLPAGIAALDEYGIPLEVGKKIQADLRFPATLDAALERLRDESLTLALSGFEAALVTDARSCL